MRESTNGGGMFKGERGFFAFIVICLLFAAIAWAFLRPAFPSLPTREHQKAEEGQYSPGSPNCYPSRLNDLPDREAANERYRCETQADQHRLQNDDLIQQTRSADAAVEAVGLTYRQLLMELAGTIFGVLTLLAAAYAAWYARRAAEAGGAANRIAQTSAERQLRAYMAVSECQVEIFYDDDQIIMQVTLENCGQTPAHNVRIMAESYAAPYPLEVERPFLEVEEDWYTTVGPGKTLGSTKSLFAKDVGSAFEAAKDRSGAFYIQGICKYDDAFGKNRETHFRYAFAGITSTAGLVMQPAKTGNTST